MDQPKESLLRPAGSGAWFKSSRHASYIVQAQHMNILQYITGCIFIKEAHRLNYALISDLNTSKPIRTKVPIVRVSSHIVSL